ncbi:DUF6777 domain-containing protein [Streptomyces sp. NRRL S-87]|uniref:DUF6777 domain-containing protein n=1 Tax=Streptomyces sp. NRRL S-87 TaxID=1463920 RepID=UPI0004BF84BC|nr:DUF6777 domain-containing protein [Streptomyces sp. NRRL S-87]
MAAAVTLGLVLSHGSAGAGELFLQPAASAGPDPFTQSTAQGAAVPQTATPQSPTPAGNQPTRGTTSISGNTPGVYAGTRNVPSCDVEKQISLLKQDPSRNAAFAGTLGVAPATVPGYLRALTPVQLRADTRVTNHGYQDGKTTTYQSVLQAGTAVLVDARGVPRVRCACGNPLGEPVALKSNPKQQGVRWSTYQPAKVVVIRPAVTVVNTFVVIDPHEHEWFERHRGDHHGKHDKVVPPPIIRPPVTFPPTPGKTSPSPGGTSPSPSGTKPSPSGTKPSPSGTSPSSSATSPSPGKSSPSPGKSSPSPSGTSPSPSPSGTSPSPSATSPSPSKSSPSAKSGSPSPSKSSPSAKSTSPSPSPATSSPSPTRSPQRPSTSEKPTSKVPTAPATSAVPPASSAPASPLTPPPAPSPSVTPPLIP